jgi:polysaccharide deacetylase 2 family uncharacterized protein YibQ
VPEFTRRHLARYTPGLWIWGSVTCVLTFVVFGLLARIFFVGSNLSGQAIEMGQRVLIEVATGEVEGNARHTQSAESKAAAGNNMNPASATIISKEGLAPAPLASISEQTDKGVVPMPGKDGTLPWKYYARPYQGAARRPIVAVAITDLGLSKRQTEAALKLPHGFTLSFSPYAGDTRKWATSAREEGFETLVDLPMQSVDYVKNGSDPGPYGLLEDAGIEQNSDRLRSVLSRFSGYVGALAPENESFTSNLAAIRPTLTELTGHGVLLLYIKTPKNESLIELLKARQFYALGIDKVIDDDIEPGPIDKQLDDLTALAKLQGYAIGFAHSYPPTLAALLRWSGELEAQGVDLAPVSAAAMRVLP